MKKKLLTILLSLFMSLGCFVSVVHADISTINDVINVSNIPTMTGSSIPEGAWTNGKGGYLVIEETDIKFANAEYTDYYPISIDLEVTNKGNGTYELNAGIVVTFTISDNTLVNVIVSGLSDPYESLNGIYTAPTSAKIDSTEYETLVDAIDAVNNGETITILRDITYGAPITINNGKTFTIDFNDGSKTHTFKWDVRVGQAYQQDIIVIESNSNVTVKNMEFLVGTHGEHGNRIFKVNSTGKLTLNNMTLNSGDSIKNTPVQNNGGTVTIDGGNITTNESTNNSIPVTERHNPIVQNLGGTTTFTGNGTYTMQNANTGVAWIGRVITQSTQSKDADRDSECGTVIIENGTFNGGHIVDVNGKGDITINDATYIAANGPIIETFHGGIKSNITVKNITASVNYFAYVIEKLITKIDFQNGNVKYMPNRFCIDNSGNPTTSVSVKNGKFGPKSGSDDIHDEINNLLATGATITKLTDDSDGYTYKVETPPAVCKIGNTTYPSLEKAIEEASFNDTITLLKDIDVKEAYIIDKNIILDLNGKTIASTADFNRKEVTNAIFTVKRGATLTVDGNGTITCENTPENRELYGVFQLTYKGEPDGDIAKLVINSGAFKGYYYTVVGNGNRHNTEVIINGGTLSNDNPNGGSAIYNPQDGKVVINNGTIVGYETGIEMRAGQLEINGGNISAIVVPTDTQPNGSGTSIKGAGIGISQHNTKKPINVTINGGEISGYTGLFEKCTETSPNYSVISIKITGGIFKAINGGVNGYQIEDNQITRSITGGWFTNEVLNGDVPNKYKPSGNLNGKGAPADNLTPYTVIKDVPKEELDNKETGKVQINDKNIDTTFGTKVTIDETLPPAEKAKISSIQVSNLNKAISTSEKNNTIASAANEAKTATSPTVEVEVIMNVDIAKSSMVESLAEKIDEDKHGEYTPSEVEYIDITIDKIVKANGNVIEIKEIKTTDSHQIVSFPIASVLGSGVDKEKVFVYRNHIDEQGRETNVSFKKVEKNYGPSYSGECYWIDGDNIYIKANNFSIYGFGVQNEVIPAEKKPAPSPKPRYVVPNTGVR